MTTVQKQKQLQFLGYYKGRIDGIWGNQSIEATKAFQADHGLVVDGIFGAKTETKTIELVVAIQMQIGATVDGLVGSETISKYKSYQDKKTGSDGDWWGQIKYFDRDEFRCKCGKHCNGFPVEPAESLVMLLDQIRDRVGLPVYINSGIRCKAHNTAVGGASNSRHLYGDAADIRCPGKTPRELYNIAESLLPGTGGIGLYSWGIHVDTRSTKARWNG